MWQLRQIHGAGDSAAYAAMLRPYVVNPADYGVPSSSTSFSPVANRPISGALRPDTQSTVNSLAVGGGGRNDAGGEGAGSTVQFNNAVKGTAAVSGVSAAAAAAAERDMGLRAKLARDPFPLCFVRSGWAAGWPALSRLSG